MSIQGAQIEFQDGTVIFRQGDPGGDLYFIKEGKVEVFREDKGFEVSLATLGVGEVLGIMTCLTREPRLACARAKGSVRVVVVKQAGIKTLISSTPSWVNTVIKDFILRIKHMDELYARAMGQLEKQQRDASLLELAVYYASGLSELAALTTPGDTGAQLVDMIAAQKRLARVLGVEDAELERIFQVFVEVGLLKIDAKAKERRAELPVLERLAVFAQFAREYRALDQVRKVYESIGAKDCGVLLHLCERARAKFGAVNDEQKLDLTDVPADKADAAAAKAAVEKAAAVGLLRFDAPGSAKFTFTPNKMGQALRCLAALHKLRALAPAPRGEKEAIQILTENF